MLTCGYKVLKDGVRQFCGAKASHVVEGHSKYGNYRQTHVCPAHVHKAMGEWNFDTVQPVEQS